MRASIEAKAISDRSFTIVELQNQPTNASGQKSSSILWFRYNKKVGRAAPRITYLDNCCGKPDNGAIIYCRSMKKSSVKWKQVLYVRDQ